MERSSESERMKQIGGGQVVGRSGTSEEHGHSITRRLLSHRLHVSGLSSQLLSSVVLFWVRQEVEVLVEDTRRRATPACRG